MKIKTSELIGPTLDWAVVAANERNADYWLEMYLSEDRRVFCSRPSMQWLQGGPIIERESIDLMYDGGSGIWSAAHPAIRPKSKKWRRGPTPLVAAMRCFIASELGDEVEIPEELCK